MIERSLLVATACLVALAGPAVGSGNEIAPLEAIGWKLFFDPRLSGPGTFSCASCHQPGLGFSDGRPRARGVYGDTLPRHTPRLTDLAGAGAVLWDGRAASLEEQIPGPITHPKEMDLPAEAIGSRVAESDDYRRVFARLGVEVIDRRAVISALAVFVRSLEAGPTALDRWLAGERGALGAAASRGRMIFFTRGQCATCHIGPALSDHGFHNVGSGTTDDPGRFLVTGRDEDRGRFKTPPLRGVPGTGPFFHDGRFSTLEEVVDHYSDASGDHLGENELDPLELEDDEKADLVTFLRALAAPAPDWEPYRLVWQRLLADRS